MFVILFFTWFSNIILMEALALKYPKLSTVSELTDVCLKSYLNDWTFV